MSQDVSKQLESMRTSNEELNLRSTALMQVCGVCGKGFFREGFENIPPRHESRLRKLRLSNTARCKGGVGGGVSYESENTLSVYSTKLLHRNLSRLCVSMIDWDGFYFKRIMWQTNAAMVSQTKTHLMTKDFTLITELLLHEVQELYVHVKLLCKSSDPH